MRFFIFLVWILSLYGLMSGCQSKHEEGLAQWGSTSHLQHGILNKYHQRTLGDDIARRNIAYSWLRADGDTLHHCGLRINLDTSIYFKYLLNGQQWEVIDYDASWISNNREIHINQKEPFSWVEPTGSCTIVIDEANGRLINHTITQTAVRDTTVNGEMGKVLGMSQFVSINSDTVQIVHSEEIYLKNIGQCYNDLIYKGREIQVLDELVEQMDHQQYKELKEEYAQIKRVGHIEDLSDVRICHGRDQIDDYHNSSNHRAQFVGGKGPLRDMLEDGYLSGEHEDVSGYLTYRFLINCEGEAGGFVAETTGLDYQPISVDADLVDYFLQKLKNTPKWQPLKLGEEYRDAYTYITIKLQNGKIDEVLP